MSGKGFQTAVNTLPAIGVAGDFASTNPRFTVLAGPGALVAGPNGATVGRFAWLSAAVEDSDGAPALVNNTGSGPVAGFVGRRQQGLITTYLADASMLIPAGFNMELFSGGDFLVQNDGATQALPGQVCYANYADGKATFGSATTATSTSYTIAAETNSFTGAIQGNILTVTGAVTGTIVPGTICSGTGVATNTEILTQLSGTPGGDGIYTVSIGEQNVAATVISGTYGLLTIAATITGVFNVGDTLTGTGVSAGTRITANALNGTGLTGTGGAGTYAVQLTQTASSGTITAATNVATKWIAMSTANPGELVKISSQPLG